jgi:hypothetical protein
MQADGSWLSGVFQCLSQDVTLLMHSFSKSIGFGGFKIDRLVAYRAFDFWLSGERHKAPRTCLWPWTFYNISSLGNTKIQPKPGEVLDYPPARSSLHRAGNGLRWPV